MKMCMSRNVTNLFVSLSHGTKHGIVATNLWTILFVFSLCVANLIKFGLQNKKIVRKKKKPRKVIEIFNIPLKPTYYHRTKQHNVACDVK